MKKRLFDVLIGLKKEVMKSISPSDRQSVYEVLSEDKGSDNLVDTPQPEFALVNSKTPIDIKTPSTPPETRYFQIQNTNHPRRIAYTISGDMKADNILICLPGLLETKASFSLIHTFFLHFEGCQVISIDFSGRGESDYLKQQGAYKMSLYLADIRELIQDTVLAKKGSNQRITILGTSMGGVLAMYLTQIFGKKIHGIIFNDIALTVNWTSLYMLYKSMKNDSGFQEVWELAKDLNVDEKAISDVQLPGHFDLSYQADVWGMNFHESLKGFKGKIGLIYGSESKICTKHRVVGMRNSIPHVKTFEVFNAGHPAPYDLLVCDFIQSQMSM